jgi:alanyl-tRNA synthetase
VTERLYYRDPYLRAFEARVVAYHERIPTHEGRSAVVLDATAFFPTGGGQPHDTGTLNDARVIDVLIDEHENVLHVLDRPFDLSPTTATTERMPMPVVRGEVDWERRFDHMQQHTGQHILSQAFIQVAEVETVGFHMGEQLSTIDLNRAPLAPDIVQRAEKRANETVLATVEVTAYFVDEEEMAASGGRSALRARKMPPVEGPLRIVEVAGFDRSPCGGTHVRNTGQIGPIKVVRIERRKNQTRIYFVCGWRALSDYAYKHEIVNHLAAHLTTSETEIVSSVERMEAETKALRKALTAAQMEALDYEIERWAAQAEQIGGRIPMRVVRRAFDERDMLLLKEVARRLVEQPNTVALLATRQPRPQFVFARSQEWTGRGPIVDMGDLIRAACTEVGGRGGGRPEFAQGGAPEGESVTDQVLDEAERRLRNL